MGKPSCPHATGELLHQKKKLSLKCCSPPGPIIGPVLLAYWLSAKISPRCDSAARDRPECSPFSRNPHPTTPSFRLCSTPTWVAFQSLTLVGVDVVEIPVISSFLECGVCYLAARLRPTPLQNAVLSEYVDQGMCCSFFYKSHSI